MEMKTILVGIGLLVLVTRLAVSKPYPRHIELRDLPQFVQRGLRYSVGSIGRREAYRYLRSIPINQLTQELRLMC